MLKAAYELRISVWSSDVCSSDLGILGRVMSYAHLTYAGNMSDPEIGRFYQSMQERVNAITTDLLFFVLEINRIEEAGLEAKLQAPELAHFRPWLRDVRAFREHQLSDELEKLRHERSEEHTSELQ